MSDTCLSTSEAAEALRCSVEHVRQLIRTGQLYNVEQSRPGGAYRIPRDELIGFLAAQGCGCGGGLWQAATERVDRVLQRRVEQQQVPGQTSIDEAEAA